MLIITPVFNYQNFKTATPTKATAESNGILITKS